MSYTPLDDEQRNAMVACGWSLVENRAGSLETLWTITYGPILCGPYYYINHFMPQNIYDLWIPIDS